MKSCKPLLFALSAAALLSAGNLFAQDAPTTTPAAHSAVYQTAQGELTVNSQPAPAPSFGPAPSFQQLSAGGKSISAEQADAYPPLANDFLNADKNRDGHISKSEYERWLKQR